ncbi:MAG TPA: hypothetical protein VKT70_04795 [Stellaceae bacterium]|nr:hypothetical protein [Stellaceae bacterium]
MTIAALPDRRTSPSTEIEWHGYRWRLQFGIAGDPPDLAVREIFIDPVEDGLRPLHPEWRSFVHDAAIDASLHLREGKPAEEMAKRYRRPRPSLLALMYEAAAEVDQAIADGEGWA